MHFKEAAGFAPVQSAHQTKFPRTGANSSKLHREGSIGYLSSFVKENGMVLVDELVEHLCQNGDIGNCPPKKEKPENEKASSRHSHYFQSS